jgi:hypothetical protein
VRGQRQHPGQTGGAGLGPNPTDRAKPGVKIHLVTDARGLPLVVRCEPANRHDSVWFEALIDAIPPPRTPSGRRCWRPGTVHADTDDAIPRCRRALQVRRIGDRIARVGSDPSDRLGPHRWVAEQRLALLKRLRRVACRYERPSDIYQAFVTLACCLICHHRLTA